VNYVVDATQPDDNLAVMLEYLPGVFQAAGLAVVGPQLAAVEFLKREEGYPPTNMAAIQRYRDEGHALANELIKQWHQERRSSVYLNLDRDDELPALVLDAALSRDGVPGMIIVFRELPPAEGSVAEFSPPEGLVLPPGIPGRQKN
jgi:hypothetical protein